MCHVHNKGPPEKAVLEKNSRVDYAALRSYSHFFTPGARQNVYMEHNNSNRTASNGQFFLGKSETTHNVHVRACICVCVWLSISVARCTHAAARHAVQVHTSHVCKARAANPVIKIQQRTATIYTSRASSQRSFVRRATHHVYITDVTYVCVSVRAWEGVHLFRMTSLANSI